MDKQRLKLCTDFRYGWEKKLASVKGICTYTENTKCRCSQDQPERKVTESIQRASEKHFKMFVHAGDGQTGLFKNTWKAFTLLSCQKLRNLKEKYMTQPEINSQQLTRLINT